MKINDITNKDLTLEFSQKINKDEKLRGDSFNNFLSDALNKVNDLQIEADSYNKLLATNQVSNLHEVTIAAEKANIAMQITLTVRNKIVDAYNEIMRMQI